MDKLNSIPQPWQPTTAEETKQIKTSNEKAALQMTNHLN